MQKKFIKHHYERKLQYCGHITHKSSVQKLLLEGKVAGNRERRRPRRMWIDDRYQGMDQQKIIRTMRERAQDRNLWRAMTADLLRADSTT